MYVAVEDSCMPGFKPSIKSGNPRSEASVISLTEKDLITHYMDNIGWMIKLSERRFLMLFSDGIRVAIDAKEQVLEYDDAKSKEHQR